MTARLNPSNDRPCLTAAAFQTGEVAPKRSENLLCGRQPRFAQNYQCPAWIRSGLRQRMSGASASGAAPGSVAAAGAAGRGVWVAQACEHANRTVAQDELTAIAI